MIWLLFIALEIARNWYMIERANSKPIYFQSFIIRGFAHILICVFVHDVQGPDDWLPILLFHVTSFWILFDLGLILVRPNKKWYYRGKTSGWLDRLPSIIYWLLKIAALTYLIQYL